MQALGPSPEGAGAAGWSLRLRQARAQLCLSPGRAAVSPSAFRRSSSILRKAGESMGSDHMMRASSLLSL